MLLIDGEDASARQARAFRVSVHDGWKATAGISSASVALTKQGRSTRTWVAEGYSTYTEGMPTRQSQAILMIASHPTPRAITCGSGVNEWRAGFTARASERADIRMQEVRSSGLAQTDNRAA